MADNITMHAKDSLAASLAECYVTIDGSRYNFMSLISFEATWTPNIVAVPILGRTGKGHKPVGGEGSFTGTAHYNTSVLRRVLQRYQNTGYMPYFEIQVTNDDPTSETGRQTVILHDCLLSSGVIAKFDSDGEILEEDVNGTFDSWSMPESFSELNGMM